MCWPRFQENAARQVVRESAGYPYFIQEYGLELWNEAEASSISSADVEAVREIVTDSLARNFFGTRFQLATDVPLCAEYLRDNHPITSFEDQIDGR